MNKFNLWIKSAVSGDALFVHQPPTFGAAVPRGMPECPYGLSVPLETPGCENDPRVSGLQFF